MNDGNAQLASALGQVARALEAQGANPFRVKAYRHGAAALRKLERPVREVFEQQGLEGLQRELGIGPSLGNLIADAVRTGRVRLLDRLRGASPEDVFKTLPGIGDGLARKLHDELGLQTLDELEAAAHDGRLAALPGFAARRVEMLKEELAGRLQRWRHEGSGRGARAPDVPPPVRLLLEVDEEYRRRAEAGQLPTITPRRFNPRKEAWLPVLHGEREGWSFTALYSNTARAHELGATRDWVVIYFEQDGRESQCTVVTETWGVLTGQRVVRGREDECRRLHEAGPAQAELPLG